MPTSSQQTGIKGNQIFKNGKNILDFESKFEKILEDKNITV